MMISLLKKGKPLRPINTPILACFLIIYEYLQPHGILSFNRKLIQEMLINNYCQHQYTSTLYNDRRKIPAMRKPISRTVRTITPKKEPQILPFPPFKLAPPMTTAATAKSSKLAENWVCEPME